MIWFVGLSYKEYRDYFDAHGIKYGVFADITGRKIAADKKLPRINVDFTNESTIEASLESSDVKVSGIVSIYEAYVYSASVIAQYFGVPGMPAEAALACTDKNLMRQKFHDYNPAITPDFRVIGSFDDVKEFMSSHDYPVILKPANLVKSLLVTKNDNAAELETNFKYASKTIHHLYEKHSVKREPKLLIEEFMEGSVHSIDAFIGQDGEPHILKQIVDYETGYDIGKSENYHYSRRLPSRLPMSIQDQMIEVASEGVKALGMKSSPAHIELILTNAGPKIVEIGARIGGYRTRMHSFANGIDMIRAALNIAEGRPVDIKAKTEKYCAVIEIFPDKAGEFVEISGLDKLLRLPSLISHRIVPKPGTKVGLSSEGHKASVIVMVGNDDKNAFENDYNFIKNNVSVKTI